MKQSQQTRKQPAIPPCFLMQATKKPSESHWCGQRRSPELQPHSGKPNLPQALACNCCWRKKKKRKSDQHNVPTSNMFCNLIADGKFPRWFSLLVRDDLAAGLDDTSMILAVAGRFCRTSSFSCPTTVQTWQVSKCTKNFPKTTSTISISIILGQTFLVASMFCDDWMLRVSPDCWGCKWSIPRSLLDLTQSYPRHLRDSGVPAWKPSSSISWTYYCTYCVDQAKWIPITDNPNWATAKGQTGTWRAKRHHDW